MIIHHLNLLRVVVVVAAVAGAIGLQVANSSLLKIATTADL